MMALSGVPLLFSGFWSKDGILEALREQKNQGPFYLGAMGALLTAFYMTRQMFYVFAGNNRGHHREEIHESPRVMTVPLVVLAVFAIGLGFLGTPVWPWIQNFVEGQKASFDLNELAKPEIVSNLLLSTLIVSVGIFLGWWLYGRKAIGAADEPDALERLGKKTFF